MTLREYMLQNKMTAEMFSAKSGMSINSIWRYMNGGLPNIQTAVCIEDCTEGQVKVRDWLTECKYEKVKRIHLSN